MPYNIDQSERELWLLVAAEIQKRIEREEQSINRIQTVLTELEDLYKETLSHASL